MGKYNTTYDWMLSDGEGEKIVYAFFKDLAGNISSPVSYTTTVVLYKVNEDFSDSTFDSKLAISGSGSYPWAVKNSRFENTNDVISTTSASNIVFTPTNNVTLTFDYGISSRPDYDKLTITLKGSDGSNVTIANAISGTKNEKANQSLKAGVTYTLTVSYAKSWLVSWGYDNLAYIDNLVIE